MTTSERGSSQMETRDQRTRCAILADVSQLLKWATRGMVIAGTEGGGYFNRGLVPREITYVRLPVVSDIHFPADMGQDFPILMELRTADLADRCVLSLADVAAIHFRTQKEKENYQLTATQTFGMGEDVLVVSPDLFLSNLDNGRVERSQVPFDQALLDQLEARASVALHVKFIATEPLAVDFLKAVISKKVDLKDELLRAISEVLNQSEPTVSSDLYALTKSLIGTMSEEVLTSKSDNSPESSLAVLDRVQAATEQITFVSQDFADSVSTRLVRLRDIVVSDRALAPVQVDATSERKLLFALLISLIRPTPRDFLYWVKKEQSGLDVRLAAGVFTGLRNHRWRILDRKIRPEHDEVQLSRSISAAMANGSGRLSLDDSFLPSIKPAAEPPPRVGSIVTPRDIVIAGQGLRQLTQTLNRDGSFTLRIVADSLDYQPMDPGGEKIPPAAEAVPKSPAKKSRTNRKAVGSALTEPLDSLFPDKAD